MLKIKSFRNPDYLRYVRSHCSLLSWDPPAEPWPDAEDPLFDPLSFETVAHHVRMGGNGGVGLKPSDYRTVPLTDGEHRALHQTGERSWWLEHGVDPRRVIIALLSGYVGGSWPDLDRIPEEKLDEAIKTLESIAESAR